MENWKRKRNETDSNDVRKRKRASWFFVCGKQWTMNEIYDRERREQNTGVQRIEQILSQRTNRSSQAMKEHNWNERGDSRSECNREAASRRNKQETK